MLILGLKRLSRDSYDFPLSRSRFTHKIFFTADSFPVSPYLLFKSYKRLWGRDDVLAKIAK